MESLMCALPSALSEPPVYQEGTHLTNTYLSYRLTFINNMMQRRFYEPITKNILATVRDILHEIYHRGSCECEGFTKYVEDTLEQIANMLLKENTKSDVPQGIACPIEAHTLHERALISTR
jgi:hypothetical protein